MREHVLRTKFLPAFQEERKRDKPLPYRKVVVGCRKIQLSGFCCFFAE